MSVHRLVTACKRLTIPPPPPLNPDPTNAFEVAIAERLRSIEAELDRMRTRLNWLFTLILAAAITNVALGLL